MKVKFQGVFTALVTPFEADGRIDEDAFRRLVEYQIDQGINGVVPCGTTGEAATLSADEQRQVIRATVETAKGRVPVIAGAGGSDTRAVAELAKRAVEAGADAILTASPPYNKPTLSGLEAHYRAVVEAASGRPVVVYNVPGRTGANLTPETILKLAQIPGIAAVKEASGNIAQVEEILMQRDERFAVLSGDDSLTLPFLALGVEGVISVVSNQVPKEFGELVQAGLKGDFNSARRIHFRFAELMRMNFVESNPIPVKTAMVEMGLLKAAHFRLPLTPLTAGANAKLVACLDRVGLRRNPT